VRSEKTDQQYAIIDAHQRHLTGGVDQYLALRAGTLRDAESARGLSSAERVSKSQPPGSSAARAMPPGSAERRAAEKEVQAIDRKLAKLELLRAAVHERLAQADQSNFAALTELTNELRDHDSETADLEARWLILTSQLEA
jgi:hypothetical protein